MGELTVDTAYPASWRAAAPPLLADEVWSTAMAGRIEGEQVWFSRGEAPGGGPEFGIGGFVVSDPGAYPLGNAGTLFADPDSPLAPEAARDGLTGLDKDALYPHLLLTYPGYATFPIGRGDAAEGLAAVVEWARERGLAAVALPYTEADSPLDRAARALGAREFDLGGDAYLDVPEDGFDGYLAALPSKRRTAVRAERRALRGHGVRVRVTERPDAALLDRMAGLRTANRRKYGLPADHRAELKRLETVAAALEGRTDLVVLDAEDGGPPIGFTLFVRDGDVWHALYTGADEDDPRAVGAYFESTYYTPVERAREAGVRRISYGLGADEAKRLRGCSAVPVRGSLLGLVPAAARVADRAADVWKEAAG
ncbi:GNAT family N-acetyltransferase [Nocardiopsis sp. RSe5-2]|uniref:GNAT family N-acetyltransferase n=1 Tax=Nocardiopsis endophytica TaxID=3018445 RepID=A0ABT4U9C4_9ACTN|nr:GNAT family N-acetyltransferase [Nocardiopsis endophytica]MDA2813547.1 GNAT family N-acetyltransferase [Nocardiopsis endophytica]